MVPSPRRTGRDVFRASRRRERRQSHVLMRRSVQARPSRRPAEYSLWSSLTDACDHPGVRVVTPQMRKPTRSVADIFSGDVDTFTAVGGEHSHDLRLSEIHFKSGARNRWHTHTTDQILICTEGDGLIATDAEQHDLAPGVIVLIPAKTRHWHGAKPGKNMTHWSILGPADTRIAD